MSIIKTILIGISAVFVLIVIVQIVNASKYKMVVQVVEKEGVLGINPLADKLDFGDLSRNNGMTRFVTLKSGGGMETYIWILKFGGISDLVTTDKTFFVLKPGEEVKISFEIKIPDSAEFKKYSGRAWIFRVPKPF